VRQASKVHGGVLFCQRDENERSNSVEIPICNIDGALCARMRIVEEANVGAEALFELQRLLAECRGSNEASVGRDDRHQEGGVDAAPSSKQIADRAGQAISSEASDANLGDVSARDTEGGSGACGPNAKRVPRALRSLRTGRRCGGGT